MPVHPLYKAVLPAAFLFGCTSTPDSFPPCVSPYATPCTDSDASTTDSEASTTDSYAATPDASDDGN